MPGPATATIIPRRTAIRTRARFMPVAPKGGLYRVAIMHQLQLFPSGPGDRPPPSPRPICEIVPVAERPPQRNQAEGRSRYRQDDRRDRLGREAPGEPG